MSIENSVEPYDRGRTKSNLLWRWSMALFTTLSLTAAGLSVAGCGTPKPSNKSTGESGATTATSNKSTGEPGAITAISDPKPVPDYFSAAVASVIMGETMQLQSCGEVNNSKVCSYLGTVPYDGDYALLYIDETEPSLLPGQTNPCDTAVYEASGSPSPYIAEPTPGGCVLVPGQFNNENFVQVYVNGTYIDLTAAALPPHPVLDNEIQAAFAIASVLAKS